ncbi:MAG: ATP-binding protein [Solirubrobacteraceae bacterium]
MASLVVTLPLRSVEDVLLARRRARDLAGLLQLDGDAQSRLATAVWEVARAAQRSGSGGETDFAVRAVGDRDAVQVTVRGVEGEDLDLGALSPLVDEVAGAPGEVRLTCLLNADAWLPGAEELTLVLRSLQRHESGAPEAGVEELRAQNAELVAALAALREREAELSAANRGVTELVSELQEQAADLRAAATANARFLHGLAHELRTPLYAVRGMTEAILRDAGPTLDPTTAEDVRLIDRAIVEALELVNDQLDLARLQAGRDVVRLGDVDVAELLGTLGGVLRRLPRPDGVALELELPGALPPVRTDAQKLTQILRNLVVNALKVTEAGTVRVTAIALGDQAVRFAVQDTGPGLDATDRARVFEEWVQLGTQTSEIRGTGLGLPLVRRLSELLGGTVTVASTPGSGATFTLDLPLAHPGASEQVQVIDRGTPTGR